MLLTVLLDFHVTNHLSFYHSYLSRLTTEIVFRVHPIALLVYP